MRSIIRQISFGREVVGKANAGKLTSKEAWQIAKLSYDASNNLSDLKYAGGSPAFVFIMDNYATYNFS